MFVSSYFQSLISQSCSSMPTTPLNKRGARPRPESDSPVQNYKKQRQGDHHNQDDDDMGGYGPDQSQPMDVDAQQGDVEAQQAEGSNEEFEEDLPIQQTDDDDSNDESEGIFIIFYSFILFDNIMLDQVHDKKGKGKPKPKYVYFIHILI